MLMTFDLTPSGKSLIIKSNDLINDNTIDFRSATIPIRMVARIVLEQNEEDGVNITFLAGPKETINKSMVSRVGAITSFANNQELMDALLDLTGL